MARPKAPCGTISAYRRHLRDGAPIDEACKRAKREHNRARSNSAASRLERAESKPVKSLPSQKKSPARPPVAPPPDAPVTEEGHISRVEVLKEMLQTSRETLSALKGAEPSRLYLLLREQREIVREISEIQGNGQVKGVTLADQLAEARSRRAAGA